MTTSDYLTQLQQDREDLVDNLETKGITGLTGDETFTELVPEVLNISGGGDPSEYFNTEPTTISGTQWALKNYIIKFATLTIPNNLTIFNTKGLFYDWPFSKVPKVICANNMTGLASLYGYSISPSSMGGKITTIDLSGLDTSNVENISYMFAGQRITNEGLTWGNFDVSKVKSASAMFYYCQNLTTLDLSHLSFKSANNMSIMFSKCTQLTSINFGNDFFDDTNTTTDNAGMGGMFDGCTALTSLDLSSFKVRHINNTYGMFNNCKNLTHIDMRDFDFAPATNNTNMFGASASTGVPDNCEIIVADDTQKTWINTNFSRLTNVKTVVEYEASLNA